MKAIFRGSMFPESVHPLDTLKSRCCLIDVPRKRDDLLNAFLACMTIYKIRRKGGHTKLQRLADFNTYHVKSENAINHLTAPPRVRMNC